MREETTNNLKKNKMGNIKTYEFDYNYGEAEAILKVDLDVFKEDMAKELLDFFGWEYDDETIIDDLLKKYAMKAISVATSEYLNEYGVKRWFAEQEGFIALDGSQGIELILVSMYEFDDELLEVTIS